MNLALARTPLSSASNAHTSGGSLSGGSGALARREAARLGRALAQQTLDRPADDGIRMPRKGERVDLRFRNDKPYRIEPRACPQLEDSQDYRCMIHRVSADSELTDAPLRPSGRSMGQDQGYFAGT